MRGFTLIELIAFTAIFTLLLAFGLPNFKGALENHHAKSNLSVLRQTLLKARVLALQLGQEVLVCPMENQLCSDNWSLPLSVFSDKNKNYALDNTEKLYMQVNNQLKHGYWQKKRATQNYIKFNPLGHAFGSATTFLYCPNSNKNVYAKQLVISFQGRIRTNSYLNSQGSAHSNINPLECSIIK